MHGLGRVDAEQDEPVIHEAWEGVVFSTTLATNGQGIYNLDEFRHGIKVMAAAVLLAFVAALAVKLTMILGKYMRQSYHGRYYAQNLVRKLEAAYDDALGDVDLLLMPALPR